MQIECEHTVPWVHERTAAEAMRDPKPPTSTIMWCPYCGAFGNRDLTGERPDTWRTPKWEPSPTQCAKCKRDDVELIDSGSFFLPLCAECRKAQGRCLKCKALRHDCCC
jgi:hypothetical protein